MKSKIAVETEETFRKVLYDVLKNNSEKWFAYTSAFRRLSDRGVAR
jgi:hypothetical protein